jgi:hypothetical protein
VKLLVAAPPRAPSDNDFSFVPEGEILYNVIIVCCSSDSCGCARALSGTLTSKAITSARVEEVDISETGLSRLAADVGEKSGWGESVSASFAAIREAIADIEPGTIVRPKFDFDAEDWEYIPENWAGDD